MIASPSQHVDRRYDLVLEHAVACAEVSTVSYNNAVAPDGGVVPCLLRAIRLNDELAETSNGPTHAMIGDVPNWPG